jgi:hypothetical protein
MGSRFYAQLELGTHPINIVFCLLIDLRSYLVTAPEVRNFQDLIAALSISELCADREYSKSGGIGEDSPSSVQSCQNGVAKHVPIYSLQIWVCIYIDRVALNTKSLQQSVVHGANNFQVANVRPKSQRLRTLPVPGHNLSHGPCNWTTL